MQTSLQHFIDEVIRLSVNRNAHSAASNTRLSIVVPTLNAEKTLQTTLQSIKNQDLQAIEVIIIDGGSTDGTIALIKQYSSLITAWISEPDSGISHAFNRGIALSTADLIQIINSGDLLGKKQIETAISLLQANPQAGFAYGDVIMRDSSGRITRRASGSDRFQSQSLPFDSMAVAPHPSVCVRRSTYEQVGVYDPNFTLAMDFDWLARCWNAKIRGVYSSEICAIMEEGGLNNRYAFRRDLENYRITRRYRTMPHGLALLRLMLRMLMNAIRLSLSALGQDKVSYVFRRWVDRRLGRH